MNTQEWLSTLKVGDEVAVYHSGSFYGRWEFLPVSGETAKYFKVGGYRYRKDNGREAGNAYSSSIQEATTELKAEQLEKQLRMKLTRRLDAHKWGSEPTATLQAVVSMLKKDSK